MRRPVGRRNLSRHFGLAALVCLQAFCVLSLFGDMVSDQLPFRLPLTFIQTDGFEYVQNMALLVSLLFTSWELFHLVRRNRFVESELRAASGAFHELLTSRFHDWSLTASEMDVALLAVKGFGITEIAGLRRTRDGTVKAQLNAIYRKAGVSGRPQLISLFIEELMGTSLTQNRQSQIPPDACPD